RVVQPRTLGRRIAVFDVMAAPESFGATLTSDALTACLAAQLAPPGARENEAEDSEVAARADYAKPDALHSHRPVWRVLNMVMDRTLWRAFSVFKLLLGGPRPGSPTGYAALHP